MKNHRLEFKLKENTTPLRRYAILLLFCLLMPTLAYSQTKTVRGVVTDAKGETIAGASVTVNGTQKGTLTDFDGKFGIEALPKDRLTVSFIGFHRQEVSVGNSSDLTIVLQENQRELDEVVVVGYGTQRKATLTGAVAAIDNKEILTTKNENVTNMLTGKVPGMRILQKTSEPGSYETLFDIRGLGTPLVVIDGVPRDNFQRMDPNEIESVTVLKDASAAIYGVRAANGVILITTRKGVSSDVDKFDINYSITQTWQEFLQMPKGVSALDYMTLTNEKKKRGSFNELMFGRYNPRFLQADMEPYLNGTLSSADIIDATFDNFVPQTQHNVNISGQSKKMNYFFNLGYLEQGGIFKSGDLNYHRWNYRGNAMIKITDWMRAEILTGGWMDKKNEPGTDMWTVFKYAWNQVPTEQLYANGNTAYPGLMPDNANPVVMTDREYSGYKAMQKRNFSGQGALEIDIPGVEGLMARGMYSYDYNNSDDKEYRKVFQLYTYDPQNDSYIGTSNMAKSWVNRYYGATNSTLFQLSLNYKRLFAKKHNVSGLFLYEEAHGEGDNLGARRDLSLALDHLFAGDDLNQQGYMNAGGLWESSSKAFVGKFNYDFSGKYLFEFSFRYDGSSKFKPGKQWGFFPAVSGGWRISEEKFIQDILPASLLSNLKIRASYGKMGDDSATANQWVAGFEYPKGGYLWNGSYVNGVRDKGVVNPQLTWYTAKTFNIGADFDLFNGLLGGSFDYFVRNRDGLLARRDVSLPGTVGVGLPEENLNKDRTRGTELILTHRNKIADFSYLVSANISSTRTEWIDKIESPYGNSYERWKNSQVQRYSNIWWGKDYAGQFTNYDQIYNHGVNTGGGNQNIVPGDYHYYDWNGDGQVNDEDNHPIATRDLPLINYGITLGAAWRGFDLNILFQGAREFYVEYDEQLAEPLMYGRSALQQFMDRWHTANVDDDIFDPRTTWVPGYYPTTGSSTGEGTKAVQDASFLRIKSVEIGYNLPKKIIARAGIKDMRIFLNSYNLHTFTSLKYSDPEHPGRVASGTDWSYSLGGYKYPMNRTFSVGANITF